MTMTDDATTTTEEGPGVCVVRMRGLPFAATPEDVRVFFGNTELQEVYFVRRDGRPTGEAYVVLAPSADPQEAFQLDKHMLGTRYIELFEATAADLRAVKTMLEDRSLQGYVVRLRGLPYSATDCDVRAFMDGVQLSDAHDCIVFAHAPNGRPTGEAYVELADEQALSLAMTRHKEVMGTRYIEVFNSSKMDKLQAQKQLEGFSSPSSLDNRRWLSSGPRMQQGAMTSSHRGLAAMQPQQPQHQQFQQLYPANPAAAADPLSGHMAQCSIAPQPPAMCQAMALPPGAAYVAASSAGLVAVPATVGMPAQAAVYQGMVPMPAAAQASGYQHVAGMHTVLQGHHQSAGLHMQPHPAATQPLGRSPAGAAASSTALSAAPAMQHMQMQQHMQYTMMTAGQPPSSAAAACGYMQQPMQLPPHLQQQQAHSFRGDGQMLQVQQGHPQGVPSNMYSAYQPAAAGYELPQGVPQHYVSAPAGQQPQQPMQQQQMVVPGWGPGPSAQTGPPDTRFVTYHQGRGFPPN